MFAGLLFTVASRCLKGRTFNEISFALTPLYSHFQETSISETAAKQPDI